MAHHIRDRRNCYLQRDLDPALPEDHPRNLLFDTSSRMIAYDLIPAGSPLKTLYHWAATRRLVADIVGAEALYDNVDPYQPANMLCFEDGDRASWHFDSGNAFTVTLMLQAPEAGGAFEMVPNARSDRDPNHDYLRTVLQGERPQNIVEVAREPGSLCIFRGCNSLHRVSPVAGGVLRVMGVLVYETEPGVVGDPEVNETVYAAGRHGRLNTTGRAPDPAPSGRRHIAPDLQLAQAAPAAAITLDAQAVLWFSHA